jgi:hypothetical protein
MVVDELRKLITQRLLRPRPTYESAASLLAWADQVLPDVLTALAHAVGGSTTRRINQGTTEVYRGGFVTWTSPGGTAASMWAYVSPEGGGYSVTGMPDALYLQPDQGSTARNNPMLGHRLGQGFVWDRDLAGWENWRTWVTATDVRAAGDTASQTSLVISRFTDALAAGGLLRAPRAG